MLPKTYRVPIQEFFRRSEHHARETARSKWFVVRVKKNTQGLCRFGILINKKFDKRAVRRNTMRRALMRRIQKMRPWKSAPLSSKDFLIIISPSARTAEPESVLKDFDTVLTQAIE